MAVTNQNEIALISLAAVKPLTDLPTFHLFIANRLASKGLLCCEDGQWHPTAKGLSLICHVLH